MGEPIQLEHRLTIDGKEYHVLRLAAREPLDDIGELRCEITDGEGGPAPATLVGKPLMLTLSRAEGSQERTIAGYVVEAERSTERGDDEEEISTGVVARPRLFRLTQRADCRVFQDMAAPDIVKKVLDGAGVPAAAQSWKLQGSYPKRDYTTQYRETDFAFVRRLLSEEGIVFTVDCSSGSDVVTFFDADLGAVDGEASIPHRPGDGLNAAGDAIGAVIHERTTVPGKVNIRDYDFKRPRLDLNAKVEADDDGEKSLEVYHYPGRFTEPSNGDRLAKVLLDALRARRETLAGPTNTLRLYAGRTFELEQHPYAPLNQEYLVLEVNVTLDGRRNQGRRIRGAALLRDGERVDTWEAGERITFRAIPTEKTTYRPPRVPRAVAAPGAQIAVTTGPAGEEIYPDEHGRVKVLFPWDRLGKRDETSSLWIRTCQLPLGGSMLTPRVGWEVYLNFTDGDPDLPFIFGRMYNGKTRPPYELPKHKTRMSIQTATTPGGGSSNEIRMDDKAGSEEMFMNASKDASVSAGNNATETVGNNETRSIGSNQSLAVTDSMSNSVGADQGLKVGANQSLHVSTFMADDVGSHSLSVGGNRDLKAGGDHKRTVTGASTLTIGGLQVDLVAGSADENGLATMDDKVGAALVELTASSRSLWVDGARTENIGAAKVIISGGGRSVRVGAGLKQKVAGAILNQLKADRSDTSAGDFLEVAGGAQIVKATNVVFQAETLLSVVMGASTITLTPASVSIAGAKITLDGECAEEAALVADN
ncbi:MAG: type VI secretion system tip protein TssI/VgrG [Minicystis sp.]